MGVVNVTPDSFSDGGRYDTVEAAVEHGRRLLADGADVLDVGGESTRPGATRPLVAEELARVVPVIAELASAGALVSVDTMRAVGPDFDGTMNVDFTQFEVNERMAPGAKQFAEAYRRRYGSDPRSGHSLANYGGARICLDAVQRAGGVEAE